MQYAIGCSIKSKDGTESRNGLWCYNGLFEVILPFKGEYPEKPDKQFTTRVFEFSKWAVYECQRLTKKYRCNEAGRGKYIRNFYPVKVDSLNFPFRISIDDCIEGREHIEGTTRGYNYQIAYVDEYRPKV